MGFPEQGDLIIYFFAFKPLLAIFKPIIQYLIYSSSWSQYVHLILNVRSILI